MEFSTLLKNYIEIGMLGLCACLVIYFEYQNFKLKNNKLDEKDKKLCDSENKNEDRLDSFIKINQQQNDEFRNQLVDQINVLTKGIINGVVNHVPSVEENEKLTKVSEEIDKHLCDILEECGADRAALVQYHNGGKGINKQSFLKMSMTNEQVRLGVKPIMMEFKDQFRSVLGYFTKELGEQGHCYIDDVDDLKNVDNGMYEFMLNRGVGAKYGMAIKNASNFVIGFVCIEYNDTNKTNPDAVKKAFSERQKAIETLLNL